MSNNENPQSDEVSVSVNIEQSTILAVSVSLAGKYYASGAIDAGRCLPVKQIVQDAKSLCVAVGEELIETMRKDIEDEARANAETHKIDDTEDDGADLLADSIEGDIKAYSENTGADNTDTPPQHSEDEDLETEPENTTKENDDDPKEPIKIDGEADSNAHHVTHERVAHPEVTKQD